MPFEVGLLYNGALGDFIASHGDVFDVVSLIPETLWHESTDGPRYQWIPDAVTDFEAVSEDKAIVLHGIGLSIASGLPLDDEHVERVAVVADRYHARWYSEHLAAFRFRGNPTGTAHAGMGLPVPFDADTLRELAPKLARAVTSVDVPMLLENSAIYVEVPDNKMTEAAFLNRLAEETGAGVLLDLHNLMVNEVNRGWDPAAYLEELNLENVVEIHVAGGETLGGWYTDAHSGACPSRVWELLTAVAASAPSLRLVTFEMHESRVPVLGDVGLIHELARIRSIRDEVAARVA